MDLFVYGSLRPDLGHPLALRLAAAAPARGRAWIEGVMYDLGDYPGAVARPGAGRVHGLLHALPPGDPLWRELDEYEEVRGGRGVFARAVVPAWSEVRAGWTEVLAYLYRGEPGTAPIVASGDWAARRQG